MIHIIIITLSNSPVVYLLDVIVSVQLLVIHYELQLPAYKEQSLINHSIRTVITIFYTYSIPVPVWIAKQTGSSWKGYNG